MMGKPNSRIITLMDWTIACKPKMGNVCGFNKESHKIFSRLRNVLTLFLFFAIRLCRKTWQPGSREIHLHPKSGLSKLHDPRDGELLIVHLLNKIAWELNDIQCLSTLAAIKKYHLSLLKLLSTIINYFCRYPAMALVGIQKCFKSWTTLIHKEY